MKLTIIYSKMKKWYHAHPIVRIFKNDIPKTYLKSGDSYAMELKPDDKFWIRLSAIAKSQHHKISEDSIYEIRIGDRLKLNRIIYNALFVIALIVASFLKEWYEVLYAIIGMVVFLIISYLVLLKDDIFLELITPDED